MKRREKILAIIVIAFVAVLFLLGWYVISYRPKSAGKEAVKKVLFDPESAQFRNVYLKFGVLSSLFGYTEVCGEVNAKNRMGGYVGYTKFYFSPDGTFELDSADDNHVAVIFCKDED